MKYFNAILAHNKVTFALNIKNVVVPLMDIPTYVNKIGRAHV